MKAVTCSFALFRRFFPCRVDNDAGEPLTDEERRIYRRWEVAALVPLFALTPLLGVAWYLALKGIAGLFRHDSPGTLFLIRPIPAIWLVPAMYLGILSSAFPTEWLYRLLLRDRYPRYERFCHERAGFDGKRVLLLLGGLGLAGTAIGLFVGTRTFTRFQEDGIVISRPFGLRRHFYGYGRVEAIEHRATFQAPNGKIIDRPHYVLRFNDGASWSTREGLRDPEPDRDRMIAKLVSERSKRPIKEIP